MGTYYCSQFVAFVISLLVHGSPICGHISRWSVDWKFPAYSHMAFTALEYPQIWVLILVLPTHLEVIQASPCWPVKLYREMFSSFDISCTFVLSNLYLELLDFYLSVFYPIAIFQRGNFLVISIYWELQCSHVVGASYLWSARYILFCLLLLSWCLVGQFQQVCRDYWHSLV